METARQVILGNPYHLDSWPGLGRLYGLGSSRYTDTSRRHRDTQPTNNPRTSAALREDHSKGCVNDEASVHR